MYITWCNIVMSDAKYNDPRYHRSQLKVSQNRFSIRGCLTNHLQHKAYVNANNYRGHDIYQRCKYICRGGCVKVLPLQMVNNKKCPIMPGICAIIKVELPETRGILLCFPCPWSSHRVSSCYQDRLALRHNDTTLDVQRESMGTLESPCQVEDKWDRACWGSWMETPLWRHTRERKRISNKAREIEHRQEPKGIQSNMVLTQWHHVIKLYQWPRLMRHRPLWIWVWESHQWCGSRARGGYMWDQSSIPRGVKQGEGMRRANHRWGSRRSSPAVRLKGGASNTDLASVVGCWCNKEAQPSWIRCMS